MNVDEFVDELLPILFKVMNSTGQACHCILVSKVLDLIFGAVGIKSEPICVDYEFANPAAVDHMKSGGSPETCQGSAFIGRTGTGESGMYDHHVVTLIPRGKTAALIDPTIIQVMKTFPDVDIPMIVMDDLQYPVPQRPRSVVRSAATFNTSMRYARVLPHRSRMPFRRKKIRNQRSVTCT